MSRIYDSSYLTQRKAQKAAAASFFTPANGTAVPWGSRPLLGIKDSSILHTIKNGAMTEYTRFPTCVEVDRGCPCLPVDATGAPVPGVVTGITFIIGSVIVSWNAAPGATSYMITAYLNGVAVSSATTSDLTYRFTDLLEWQSYTFSICALNTAGQGPMVYSAFMAPPQELSAILGGQTPVLDISPCLIYLVNHGLNTMMKYTSSINLGPTIASRLMYIWVASIVQAWNWVSPDSRITGVHDNWNWTTNSVLNQCDSIVWICAVMDYVTPFIVPNYVSVYNCDPATVSRVKTAASWTIWQMQWNTWNTNRGNDGSAAAAAAMPTGSANWNNTIVVDGVTVSNIAGFPQPQQWTRLTIQGKMQKYLTYNWDSVATTCLQESDEADIQASVAPLTGANRDAEIDQVLFMSGVLTDVQKVIAEFWAGSSVGVINPPYMAMWLWKEYVRSLGATCPVIMYSLLDMAVHMFEGARVTWRLKTAYMEARPIQEIRRRYAGQQVTSWNGVIDGSQWIPYQRAGLVSPPFGDFCSGHSSFTKLFSLVMTKWFGANIVKNTTVYDNLALQSSVFTGNQTASFGDFVVAAGTSSIEPGIAPSTPVTLSFATWEDMADSAGMSRLYGGIHGLTAHLGSQTAAIQVDALVNSAWNITVSNNGMIGQLSGYEDALPDMDAVSLIDMIAAQPDASSVSN